MASFEGFRQEKLKAFYFRRLFQVLKSEKYRVLEFCSFHKKRFFLKCWKLLKAYNSISEGKFRDKWRKKRLPNIFRNWKFALKYQNQFRKAFQKLENAFYRFKFRQTWENWPGRLNIIRVEEMRRKNLFNRNTKLSIVENKLRNRDDDSNKENKVIQSFIKKSSISTENLLQRALKFGFISSTSNDHVGIKRIKLLITTLFKTWSTFTKKSKTLRILTRQVKVMHGKRILRRHMYHWMSMTTRKAISDRRSTWILKRHPAPHTLYKLAKDGKVDEDEGRKSFQILSKHKIPEYFSTSI
jgi:hypothetical protein